MINKEFQKKWVQTTVGDISLQLRGISYGKGDAKQLNFESSILVLRGGNIQDGKIVKDLGDDVYVTESLVKKEQTLLKGDVVIVSSTGSKQLIGKAATVVVDMPRISFGAFLTLLRPSKELNYKYFNYFFQTDFYRNSIRTLSGGININNIRKEHLLNIPFPLPPSAEQQRIVSKLDVVFQHIDAINEKLDQMPDLIRKIRQTLLHHAVTGKLTEKFRNQSALKNEYDDFFESEMREAKLTLPETWLWLPFSEIAFVESNLVQPLDYLDLPLIAPDNIESGSGRLISKPLVSDIMPKSAKHYFKSGSIVYSKIRPYLSKVIIADFEGLCSADAYPINTTLNTKYLFYYLLSDLFLSYSTSAGERSVLPKINQKEIAIIPISVPPIEEQVEIVKLIEMNFDVLNHIQLQYDKLKLKIEQLPQAVLKEAFSGHLVREDENDEPASELLKKIDIATTASAPQTPKKTNANTSMKPKKETQSLIETLKSVSEKSEFTFDDIRELSSASYIQLKDELYSLLDNKILEMAFNEEYELIVYKLATDETS